MKKSLPISDLDVEARLQAAFKPIKPSHNFVSTVHKRIHLSPNIEVSRYAKNRNRLVVVFGSVLSALVLLITIGRALYYLTGRSTSQ